MNAEPPDFEAEIAALEDELMKAVWPHVGTIDGEATALTAVENVFGLLIAITSSDRKHMRAGLKLAIQNLKEVTEEHRARFDQEFQNYRPEGNA